MTRPNKRALHLRHARAARETIRQEVSDCDAHVIHEEESASCHQVDEGCTRGPCQPVSHIY